jgi:hypothetical protein
MYFFPVAGIFAACLIGNKFRMVDCNQSSLNGLVWYFMAACTACFDQLFVGRRIAEEMACVTNVFVDAEMLIAFEMAMTDTACDIYSIYHFIHVILVSELNAVEVDICFQQLLCTMTFRSQAGFI